jgi:hypothetical protein
VFMEPFVPFLRAWPVIIGTRFLVNGAVPARGG